MGWIALFLLAFSKLLAADFDCVVVGTSPIPLFEALYKYHCGQKVLILEAEENCGGAWKSIDRCGLTHVDMGCHELHSSPELNRFLEEYAGCSMTWNHSNYYFSKGCFELVNNLVKRIHAAGIPLMTNCKVESVYLDTAKNEAVLKTREGNITASKIVITRGSSFFVEGSPPSAPRQPNKFYHLYLLVQDPNPPCFTYRTGISPGISRMMNLTPYVNLEGTGRQLIVFQTCSEQQFENSRSLLEDLRKANLVSPGAFLLESESYIYEQGPYFQLGSLPMDKQSFFEMLNASHFNMINTYAAKWKTALPPFREGQP